MHPYSSKGTGYGQYSLSGQSPAGITVSSARAAAKFHLRELTVPFARRVIAPSVASTIPEHTRIALRAAPLRDIRCVAASSNVVAAHGNVTRWLCASILRDARTACCIAGDR